MSSSRRVFIKNGLTFVSLGMAAPAMIARAAADASSPTANPTKKGNILVVLQMFGGNDGLNTLIPYADPLYYKNRPTIGIKQSEVVQLGPKVGLHPGMASMKTLFDKGVLGVIQGVGYPQPNLSHFRSAEIWETADPTSTVVTEGWLGRYFDDDGHLRDNPLAGINFGAELPKTLYSDYGSVVSMQSPQTYGMTTLSPVDAKPEVEAFTKLYTTGTMAANYDDMVKKIGEDAYSTSEQIKRALRLDSKHEQEVPLGSPSPRSLTAPDYPVAARGGMSPLAKNLKMVAQLMAADLGTRVFYVSQGGFDTHANQAPTQAALLQDLADSLTAFYSDLEQRGLADRVTLVTFSEFGRRVQENASLGTDHGTASCQFVIGGKVKGGLYGTYPALDDLDMGNLKFSTDFRQVYAALLDNWLGVSSQKVLNGTFQPVQFLA